MKGFKMVEGYRSTLSLRETQKAIKFVKDTFQHEIKPALNLQRISAPLFVTKSSGINDDLNGVERKVHFTIRETGEEAEVVQSLAKWKRMALHRYGFSAGEGLYTDMSAIRRDDDMDNIHSIYVDQWDWERVITPADRNIEFLKDIVRRIVKAIAHTARKVQYEYPGLTNRITEDVFFITSQELEDMYPELTGKQREYEITKEHKTVFLMQIGHKLKSGKKHDGRAPDYDDWNLNGDLLLWNPVLEEQLEISSMGIRVDAETLHRQLETENCLDREEFPYHKGILSGELPLTIGGGIGQSRLCLLLLEKLHIGEVQSSIWQPEVVEECRKHSINLL